MTSEIISGKNGRQKRIYKHILVRSHDPETNVFLLQSESSGESRLGVCFLASLTNGADESTTNKLKSVLSTMMPVDAFIQIAKFNDPDVLCANYIYTKGKVNSKGVLWNMTQARASMFELGTKTALPGMKDVMLSRQRLVISINVPYDTTKSLSEETKIFYDFVKKIEEGFNTVGLFLYGLDDKEYLSLLRRFFHLYGKDDESLDEYAPLCEQVFAPGDAINFEDDESEVNFNNGEYYAKILSVKELPSTANIGLMNLIIGDPLGSSNQIKEPYFLSATIYYPDLGKKNSQFRTKHAFTINQAFGGMTHMIPMLRYKKAGFDILAHEIDANSGVLCELNFTMMMFSRNREKLIGDVAAQRALAANYGFELREDKRILKALFYTILPMQSNVSGFENLERMKTMTVAHAIRFLPIIGDWQGSGSGGATLLSGRRGQLSLFDPYDSDTNYNGVIAAESGAGKSVLAQQLICDLLAGGARAWVIDQGRSYEKLCNVLGGQFIEFSENSDICLNPFSRIEDIDEEMDLLKAIFAKMAAPEVGLDDFRLAVLEEKIKAAYSVHGRSCDITAVAEQCLHADDSRIQDIGKQLYPYTRNGSFGRWFNGVNNVDLTNDFVVMELQELASKKTLQQVVLIQLFASIGHEMYLTHGRKKLLLVDESWALIDDPLVGKAIAAAYRKVRKHEGSAWLITQSIADLYESPNGRPIIDNANWQIIMKQKSESIDRAIKSGYLKLDGYSAAMLKSVDTLPGKYSEMMIRQSAGNWGVVKLITPRFTQILFSTKGWERDLVLEKARAGEDVAEFINQLVLEGK